MWIVLTILGVIALVVFGVVRLMSAPPSTTDPQDQPATVDPAPSTLTDLQPGETPHQPDGSPVPGSEADRNMKGKN